MSEPPPASWDLDDLARFTVSGAADEIVYKVGDPALEVFVIQEGTIELQSGAEPGRVEGSIISIGPGDVFGDEAFFSNRFRAGTAVARTSFNLLKFEAPTLTRIFHEDPELALALIRAVLLRSRVIPHAHHAPVGNAGSTIAEKPRAVDLPPKTRMPSMLVHTESGREFDIRGDRDLVVGRARAGNRTVPDVDMAPIDPKKVVSRRHARILATSDGYAICEDVATSNGTYVNGTRLDPGAVAPLRDGDEIRFGTVRVRFNTRRQNE